MAIESGQLRCERRKTPCFLALSALLRGVLPYLAALILIYSSPATTVSV